jgi:hypothetical protein
MARYDQKADIAARSVDGTCDLAFLHVRSLQKWLNVDEGDTAHFWCSIELTLFKLPPAAEVLYVHLRGLYRHNRPE